MFSKKEIGPYIQDRLKFKLADYNSALSIFNANNGCSKGLSLEQLEINRAEAQKVIATLQKYESDLGSVNQFLIN